MKKRILITGSSRGIGLKTAEILSENNQYEVVMHAKTLNESLKSIAKKLKSNCLCFDVSNTKECKQIINEDIGKNGPFYGVVLNAGITQDSTFAALDEYGWKSVIDVNLNGFFNVLNPVIMPMVREKKGGRIIVMTSIAGIIGNRGQSNYAASKAGLIGATKSLAIELASRAITVNCIAPGLIQTDMIKHAPVDEIIKLIPAKSIGKPEDVAFLVKFLMSDEARYITKQVIGVNGGLC